MIDIALIILFSTLGVLLGACTGIIPGLHVNTISIILLSATGVLLSLLSPLSSYGLSSSFILLLIASFIVSISISHSFHNAIPATFLGVPDEDTAISMLPAHRLLLQGRGYEAIVLSAIGSFGAIITCFSLLYIIRFLLGEPFMLYQTIREIMVFILIAIAIIMITTEKGKIYVSKTPSILPAVLGILSAAGLFILSGIYGLVTFSIPSSSPIGLPSNTLLPVLTGLFGAPTIIVSLLTRPTIPEQTNKNMFTSKKDKKSSILSILTGSTAGILVSIIPGVTSSTGTILAMNTRGKSNDEQTIITLSAVNTAAAFYVIVLLFIIQRARSGVAIAVNNLITIETWSSLTMPSTLIYLLIAILLSGSFSYMSTIWIGGLYADHINRLPYHKILTIVLFFVITLVVLFTGLEGLLIFSIGACIGLIPILWGIRRSHCMGVLIIPVILYLL
ncbi:MAG: tripartite tricarboxylate transporter permease [Candidatus Thermoplasmatota archaeon]